MNEVETKVHQHDITLARLETLVVAVLRANLTKGLNADGQLASISALSQYVRIRIAHNFT
ncbi:MAG: hypothetical protein OXN90_02920 [Gemmatimonadota bacterium]|nr:hypothetical protein [Gemmatimonadota bacterium]